MMTLTSGNYYTPEANREYWSVSLFKAFDRCEASGLASVRGQYEREETDALLIGSYVDAYFTGDLDEFVGRHADVMFKKNGELYQKFEHANDMIDRVEADPLMMEFLRGQKQVIMSGPLSMTIPFIIMATLNPLLPMCTLTTMNPLVTLHPPNPLSKIGNQKPKKGTLGHILCRMAQENPNAWRVVPITLPLL